jgi:phosphatidylinositol phospholipase C epsilon
MGLKSTKLRPFWLSLKHDERQRFEDFAETLLSEGQPHPEYIDAIQRALRMPQSRIIPFFGVFLRDLYAIVNSLPNVVIIGNQGEVEKLKFLNDENGEDHYSSNLSVGGLLNAEKINLVAVVLENLEIFHRHSKQAGQYLSVTNNTATAESECIETKPYEPIEPIPKSSHGITQIPLNSSTFDLDVIQKLHHGTTVIHYDLDSSRSVICRFVPIQS